MEEGASEPVVNEALDLRDPEDNGVALYANGVQKIGPVHARPIWMGC